MSAVLLPGDRVRLARVLALLSSDHAGERDAAALAAARIVSGAGLSWADLLLPEQHADRGTDRHGGAGGDDLAFCRRWARFLSPWEANFISSVSGRRLSPKQLGKLHEIAVQLRVRGAG